MRSACAASELRVQPGHRNVGGHGPDRSGRRRGVAEQSVGPRDEVLPVGAVGVPAVVLPPGELPVEQPDVHGRHLRRVVVLGHAQIPGAQQPEHRPGGHGCHEAPLVIEPVRVALLGHAVADERGPRRAERDQLVGVHGQVGGLHAAEGRLGRAVLQKVSRHPVILAGRRSGSRPPRRNSADGALRRPLPTTPPARRQSAARRPSSPARPCRSATRRRCRRAWHRPPGRSRSSRARARRPRTRPGARPSRRAFAAGPC